MDIPALSIAMNQSNLKTNVNLALMKKTMENQAQASDTMVQLLNTSAPQAAHPTLGSKLDLKL